MRHKFILSVLHMTLLLHCGSLFADKPPPPPTDCSEYPDQSTSLYVLPWPVGESYGLLRAREHFTPRNFGVGLYAIDIDMPIGKQVHAARAGTVVAIQGSFPDKYENELEENYVFVRHDDGTVARYMHLTENGPQVEIGERVEQGQLIGISGTSGTTPPHTHFDVQRCGPNLNPKYNEYPCGYTLPVVFRNTEDNPCGLVPGTLYEAKAFVPDAEDSIRKSNEVAVRASVENYVLGWYTANASRMNRSMSPLFQKTVLSPTESDSNSISAISALQLLEYTSAGLGMISVPAEIWDQHPITLLALGGEDVERAPADWNYDIAILNLGNQYSVVKLNTPHGTEILVLALRLGHWEIVNALAIKSE